MNYTDFFYTEPHAEQDRTKVCGIDVRLAYSTGRYLSPPTQRDLCKLTAGHEGRCDTEANWHGHFETQYHNSQYPEYKNMTLGARSDHDYRMAHFKSKKQIDEFCAWLQGLATEFFDSSDELERT